MSQLKTRKRLQDMTNEELMNSYQFAVRESWGENLRKGPGKNPGHNTFYQKELSLKREVLRRLSLIDSQKS